MIWDIISLFIIPDTRPTSKPSFVKVAIFSDVILVSNYGGCKDETIKLIPYYMIDILFTKLYNHHI